MMAFELRLEKPKTSRNWISALVMGSSYFIGQCTTSMFCSLFRINEMTDFRYRRSRADDTVFHISRRKPRSLYVCGHHGCDFTRIWVHQGDCDGHDKDIRALECITNAGRGCDCCRDKLWHCPWCKFSKGTIMKNARIEGLMERQAK